MGLPGRTSLARIPLLAVALSGLALAPRAALAGVVDNPRTPLPASAPNPFQPRPRDGDRDTTTFAMTSSERGRLRVVVYRYAGTRVVRVVSGGQRAAGRQRVTWSGRTSSGALLRGRFSYGSRPPTPPATPPGSDVTPFVCCESQTRIIA